MQTVQPFEVLVIDNASTDNTEEVVGQYAPYGVTYIRNEKNIGMANNFNRCIELAKSEYLTILPSDDFIAPTWYEEWITIIKKHDAGLYTSPITIVNNDCKLIWALPIFPTSRMIRQPHVRTAFEKGFTPGVPPTAMSVFKKSVLRKVGPFDPADGTEFDVRVMLALFDICDVYYHHRFLYVLREHKFRAFDEAKETKDKKFLKRLENTFSIIQDIWVNKYHQSNEHRSFLHCTLFMNLCNINLYIARLEFVKVIQSYRVCLRYFPDLFRKIEDWKAIFRYQFEFIRRVLIMYRVPANLKKELTWITQIRNFQP